MNMYCSLWVKLRIQPLIFFFFFFIINIIVIFVLGYTHKKKAAYY